MRITIMGSGGVGATFGARLASAGCDVSFVARGRHLTAIREHGLRVESALGNLHLQQVQVTDDPATIGGADLVLLAVKLWDTEAAAKAIGPLVGPDTVVISLQNGVLKDELLSRALGAEAVAGGVCYIAAAIAEPGLVRHTGTMARLVFGEHSGQRSDRLARFAAACERAGIDHEISPDISRTTWEKFVFLVGMSGSTATMRAPIGRIRDNPAARAFLRDTMAEVEAVARAEGIALPPDYAANRLAFCDQLPGGMSSSMAGDLERGHRLEVPWLSGDVVARGARFGIATPCNRAVADILAVHTAGKPG